MKHEGDRHIPEMKRQDSQMIVVTNRYQLDVEMLISPDFGGVKLVFRISSHVGSNNSKEKYG